ncbi:MAG TPA: ubiquinol-cytochrome C chaperone family protein [Stellaceae bacterium]|nr:ubiquinol-cytochrome C chaperone family protein [Stellaceae bacterium]
MGIAELFGFRSAGESRAAGFLYRAVVEQAREPHFFSSLHVPDSLDGRFETLTLHVFLMARRLKSEPSEAALGLSRALLEAFVTDMDRSLREMGATDLGVGRRVKAMAEGFYGRVKAYEVALEEPGNTALEAALRRNLYGTLAMPQQQDLAIVARYVRRQDEALAAQPLAELLAGRARFMPLADAIGPEVPP